MAGWVRPARDSDLPQIVHWTSDTFEWGDYVPTRLPSWMSDPDSVVLVYADDADRPVALCHAVMLSAHEGWLEAARVHPDHRREGLGSALNGAGVDWLRGRGARVVRLAVETKNAEARAQVERLGYRQVSSWHHATLDMATARRLSHAPRLRPVVTAEIDEAWMFWSNSDLARTGREMIATGWRWRRCRPHDLDRAAREGNLLRSAAGWVIATRADELMRVGWLATNTEQAPALLDGLIGLATDAEMDELAIKVPGVPWAVEALTRAGGDPYEILIFSLAT